MILGTAANQRICQPNFFAQPAATPVDTTRMNGNAARIYREGLSSSEPSRPRGRDTDRVQTVVTAVPSISIAPTPAAEPKAPRGQAVALELERQITEIVEAAPDAHETVEAAFRRKEQTLRDLFSTLSVAESRALHRRLTLGAGTDPLVKTFGRLVADRRNRLLAFLADVRRREAIATGKASRR
jgi:hypothetical protein